MSERSAYKIKLINFFKKKPYTLLSLYWFLQIAWYSVLGKIPGFADGYIMVEFNALDNLIPFCELFITVYVVWYPYILLTNVLLARKGTKSEYMYLALMTVIGMGMCMVGNTFFPTELVRDPELLENLGRSNILVKLTGFVYSCDYPPRTVFPSMHVYGSIVLAAALIRCKCAKNSLKIVATILSVLICLSTVFVKQHSVIDLFASVIIFIVLHIGYIMVSKIKNKTSPQ